MPDSNIYVYENRTSLGGQYLHYVLRNSLDCVQGLMHIELADIPVMVL